MSTRQFENQLWDFLLGKTTEVSLVDEPTFDIPEVYMPEVK